MKSLKQIGIIPSFIKTVLLTGLFVGTTDLLSAILNGYIIQGPIPNGCCFS